jgi:molybdopterin/thiamine biosynthesis adenylyltransferase
MDLEHSRMLRLAKVVGANSEQTLLERLRRSRVVISFESHPAYVDVAAILVETLRRLPIDISLDPGGLRREVIEQIVARGVAIDPVRGVQVGAAERCLSVHVGGGGAGADLHGLPVHHGARLATARVVEGGASVTASGLGIFTCAALLAGEVFKRIAEVVSQRAAFPAELAWCPVALNSDPVATPELEIPLDVDLALVGQGAIGTAVTHILSLLGATGQVSLVDPERFAPENLGTYSLGTAADAVRQPWKVDLGAKALRGMGTSTYRVRAEEFIELVDRGEAPWPSLVLSGLDSAEARWEVQRLWPDYLIDGATGDTMCGLHDVRSGEGACLLCLFPKRTGGPNAAERLADATGLPIEVVRQGDQPLSPAHLASVNADQRRLLEGQIGEPVCGLAEAIGLTALPSDDYRPSVPFVSQQAACLVIGRLIAKNLEIDPQPSFVQYDALFGPQASTIESRRRIDECFCSQRTALIQAVRDRRRLKV